MLSKLCGDDFTSAFFNYFFPRELRKVKSEEILNLKHRKITMKEYALKFHQLSHYASELVSSMRARMRKFTYGLSPELVFECKVVMLNCDIDISRLVVYVQQVEEEKKASRYRGEAK